MTTHKTPPFDLIETIIHDIVDILELMRDIPKMSDPSFDEYRKICSEIPGRMRKGLLKIAVVGVIKSGKSTFVNSLVGKDLVKRGAGVTTSITTRIRKGIKNQARVYFKSWDDINAQLRKALMLFPAEGSENEIISGFDIRRRKDRTYLKKAYQALITDFPVTEDGIQPETLMIRNAIQGFDACRDLVQADETVMSFTSKEFDTHKAYTADSGRAFYIRDVCLEIFGKAIAPNIEIADCQGADSTDAAQLAQIMSYLESANLIVYCISSRIGLRQSDIFFLKRIKQMGLLDNIVFINNCDFSEHDHLDDLKKIEAHIRENLEFLEINPIVFSFSSLYALFLKQESKLGKKDLTRLRLWQEEKNMIEYGEKGQDAFNLFFEQAMDKNRFELLISNHLKRLGIILAQLDRRTNIFLDLLSSDKQKEQQALEALEALHQNAARLESIVAHSIEGAVKGLKHEIISKVNTAFSRDQMEILHPFREYIRTIPIEVDKYKAVVTASGFNRILYLMFQDFKRRLDIFVIETVTPKLKTFVQTQEKRILSYFQSLFDSYQIDLFESDHYAPIEDILRKDPLLSDGNDFVDIEKIKKILGLKLPSGIFEAKYSPRIKANIFTGFFLKTLSQIMGSALGRTSGFSFSPGLRTAGAKIKKENLTIIQDQYHQYGRYLETYYFLPLIEAATREFKEKINERFSRYHSCKNEVDSLFSLKKSEKKDQKDRVLVIKQKIQKVTHDISTANEIS